ncbi:efflux RND transporter periplasmic adaptor subunit [Elioraea sp.]|uniref:efflux RND transporter periplasmic adaptor subunit n=1 Tax=Elioraea sp. TaxID=2185103 RepID=UPI0025C0C8FD|nr:efflux RND transporter periplasmic adaptor subunit [Elioraea sp.]
MRTFSLATAIIALLAVPLHSVAQQAAPPAVSVGVVAVTEEDVTQAVAFIGRIEAVDRVALVARVTGFLEQQAFRDGQEVKKDDLLFVIEREPFVASVSAAKASLASAEAQKLNADVQLARAEELVRTNNIPVATRDQRRAEAAEAAAKVLEARAALEQAEINLAYTLIRAPVAGRIGRAAFTVGNVVTPQSGTLALLVSQDPMFVTFPVSQRLLLDLKRQQIGDGQGEAARRSQVAVRVAFADGTVYGEVGEIDFVDVTVGQGTDTVAVRARVGNPQRLLTDGMFVSVRVEGREPEKKIVIPQAAIMLDQQGAFVFVAEQGRAAVRRIRTGQQQGNRIAVEDGLKPGDMLVVDGIQRIRPGVPVQAVPQAPRADAATGRAG